VKCISGRVKSTSGRVKCVSNLLEIHLTNLFIDFCSYNKHIFFFINKKSFKISENLNKYLE